jgi:hypothetical protein
MAVVNVSPSPSPLLSQAHLMITRNVTPDGIQRPRENKTTPPAGDWEKRRKNGTEKIRSLIIIISSRICYQQACLSLSVCNAVVGGRTTCSSESFN